MDDLIVIHTADWHLGKNRKFDDYLDQQRLMLAAIVAQVEKTLKDQPSAQVWLTLAGDIFDRNQDTRRDEFVLFLRGFVTPILRLRAAYPNFTVVVIDGNHDRQPVEEDPSVLAPLAAFFGDDLRMSVVKPTYHEDLDLLAIPYGGYSAAELRALCGEFNPTFVMGHECLSRMQTDTGWSPPRDQDHYIEIDEVLPDLPKIQGVFLGDIHRCQPMDAKKICWYSGSPVTLDHGHKPPKGLLHHQFAKENGLWRRLDNTKLKPLKEPKLKPHVQLGQIKSVEDIPWETIYQAQGTYIDMVVTPEVHREIASKVPDFFASPQVSSEFVREATAEIKEDSSVKESELGQTYYEKAIREWAGLNLTHMTSSVVDEFVGRAEKLFEGRG